MASTKDVLKQIKDEEIEWVDLRFTDPKGKWQHLTMSASVTLNCLKRQPASISKRKTDFEIFSAAATTPSPSSKTLSLLN